MSTNKQDISPYIGGNGSIFGFHAGAMNYFAESFTCVTDDALARALRPYSFMRISKLGEHQLNWVRSNPNVWQKEDWCKWTPKGKIGFDKASIRPCGGKVNMEICDKDIFSSCFKQLKEYTSSGGTNDTAEGQRLLRIIFNQINNDVNTGARLIGTLGQMFTKEEMSAAFAGKDESLKEQFLCQYEVCQGVFAEMKEWAAADPTNYGHLNCPDIFSDVKIGENCLLDEESILKAWEKTKKKARKKGGKLRTLINKKSVALRRTGETINARALAYVSPFFYESVAEVYETRCETLINPQCRIKQVDVGGGVMTYEIDGIALYPVYEISDLEECLGDKRVLLLYITFAENFQIGGSLVNDSGMNDLAVRVIDEGATSNKSAGVITMAAHALFSGTVLSKDLVVGAYSLATIK